MTDGLFEALGEDLEIISHDSFLVASGVFGEASCLMGLR